MASDTSDDEEANNEYFIRAQELASELVLRQKEMVRKKELHSTLIRKRIDAAALLGKRPMIYTFDMDKNNIALLDDIFSSPMSESDMRASFSSHDNSSTLQQRLSLKAQKEVGSRPFPRSKLTLSSDDLAMLDEFAPEKNPELKSDEKEEFLHLMMQESNEGRCNIDYCVNTNATCTLS